MNEGQYRMTGWLIFAVCLAAALFMCLNHSGLMAFSLNLTLRLFDSELVQISWLLTFVVLGLPGYMIKNYCEQKAWDARVAAMPKPNVRESAKRSKYVSLEDAPPPTPQAIDIGNLPEGQEEFVATCAVCGHLFSARRSQKDLKCPECGEPIPIK